MITLFLLVHDLIGLGKHFRNRKRMIRSHLKAAEAKGHGARHAHGVGAPGHRPGQPLQKLVDGVTAAAVENGDELVPAEPEDEIGFPHLFPQGLRDEAQYPVPFQMAESVVDAFKMVDVEKGHHKGPALGGQPVQGAAQGRLARLPDQKARQIVTAGPLVEIQGVGDVQRMLQMCHRAVNPAHEAVAVLKNLSGQPVILFPAVDLPESALFKQTVDRAKTAAAIHALLQHFPADFPLGMLKPEKVLHGLIHIQDAIRPGIGHIEAFPHLRHSRVDDAVMELQQSTAVLLLPVKGEHGGHAMGESLFVGRPRGPFLFQDKEEPGGPLPLPNGKERRFRRERRLFPEGDGFGGCAIRHGSAGQEGAQTFRREAVVFTPDARFPHLALSAETGKPEGAHAHLGAKRADQQGHTFIKRLLGLSQSPCGERVLRYGNLFHLVHRFPRFRAVHLFSSQGSWRLRLFLT